MLRLPSSAGSPTSHTHLPPHPCPCSTWSCTGGSTETALPLLGLWQTPAMARGMPRHRGGQPVLGVLQMWQCGTSLQPPSLGYTEISMEKVTVKNTKLRINWRMGLM